MKNYYDDPIFFEKYSQMGRSVHGLAGAGEWESLQKMLPDFRGKSVLDLGCGYGWHCLYAAEQGASRVLGIDLSEKMLEVAQKKAENAEAKVISYQCMAMEEYEYPTDTFDVVISSLALHYVADLLEVYRKVYHTLRAGGDFIFSVEHPIFTAYGNQDWIYDETGKILHWPVDHYFREGSREAVFLGETVTKQHRTLTGWLQPLLEAGFQIRQLCEPQPPEHMMELPGIKDELRRPMMLLISAKK